MQFNFLQDYSCRYIFIDVLFSAFNRNIQFFGFEAQLKVTASYVVVIGLGGVGSHAATMLLRSGVGRLLLVDFDQVPSLKNYYYYFFSFFRICMLCIFILFHTCAVEHLLSLAYSTRLQSLSTKIGCITID